MSENKTEEGIEIIKQMIVDYPNDYDLGKKVRDFFVTRGALKNKKESNKKRENDNLC